VAKKTYVNASRCHDMLRRLAEQYKEREEMFREAGKDRLADLEHEHYRTMIDAMTTLVKTHDI